MLYIADKQAVVLSVDFVFQWNSLCPSLVSVQLWLTINMKRSPIVSVVI